MTSTTGQNRRMIVNMSGLIRDMCADFPAHCGRLVRAILVV
jgi:hypothetical protein